MIPLHSEALTASLFIIFQDSSETWFKQELLEQSLKAAEHVEKAFDKDKKRRLDFYLKHARSIWSKQKSMLLIAKAIQICTDEQADFALQQIETLQKLSFGLMRHIKAKKAA